MRHEEDGGGEKSQFCFRVGPKRHDDGTRNGFDKERVREVLMTDVRTPPVNRCWELQLRDAVLESGLDFSRQVVFSSPKVTKLPLTDRQF